MNQSAQFPEARIHHIALRVADSAATTAWFVDVLGFRVDRAFSFGDRQFVWLCPTGQDGPAVELIGGKLPSVPLQSENVLENLNRPGFHHLCLQVSDVDKAVSELRRHDVKIVIDVIAAAAGSGAKKGAFIADPWGNVIELLQFDDGTDPV